MVYQNLVALHVFTPITDRKGGVLLYFVLLNRRKQEEKKPNQTNPLTQTRGLLSFSSHFYIYSTSLTMEKVYSSRFQYENMQAMFLREKKTLKYRTSHYTSVNGKILYSNTSHRAL